jgi:hypothetical protein
MYDCLSVSKAQDNMLKEEIQELFEEVLDAYVSSASDSVVNDVAHDENDEVYDEPEYKYEISRINTKAEEWRKELNTLLDN